jgi:hypothetical protein
MTTRPLLVLLALAGCAGPPRSRTVEPAIGDFPTSEVKPPSTARDPLEPLPRSAERLARQRAYFGGATRDASQKAKLLSSSAAVLGAGVRDLRAGALPHLLLHLAEGQTLSVETRRLSAGADTVLHLWSGPDAREVAFDDDGGGEAGASRISYRASAAGTYVVLLRAYSGEDDGRCDLWVDGAQVWTAAKFGGAVVPVAAGRLLQTVTLNDDQGDEPWPPSPRAASDTLLLLLEPASGALLALDDDSGVELASRMATGARAALAVVGAYSGADEGRARLVVNDAPLADSDGDGLGDELERSLCLCATASDVVCGFDCQGAATPQDSDGDGLSDAAEVLGVDDPLFPQLLPRWGGDPRHKDLFVEIDLASWEGRDSGRMVRHFGRAPSTDDAHAAARVFGRLTTMGNPDGADGVRLHLDVGHACGVLSSGIDEVCGDLCAHGRDGQRRCGQSLYAGPPAERIDGLAVARRRLFHVAVADCLVSGQSPGGPADSLEYDCDRFSALVHELGHNLGLDRHYGTSATGGGNCKPNYPSVMNYAYSDRFYGGRELQFSSGDLVGTGDLDSGDLDETRPLGGDDADVGWLATRPFFYSLHDCRSPGRGCKVDFNRDGRLDPSVRAYLSPMPGYGYICEGTHGNALGSENIEGLHASSGPAAVESPRRREDGSIAPALHVVAPTAAPGGSRLHVNYTFATSGGWQGWRPLPGPTLRADAQPAAAAWGSPEQLWVFACTDGEQPLRYAVVDDQGQTAGLQVVPGQMSGLRARDASVARRGSELLLLVRDESPFGADRVYLARHDGATWSPFTALVAEGAPLRSLVTPALAVGPDDRVYVVTADPDPSLPTMPLGRLHLYSASALPGELRDEELEGLRFEDGAPSLEHVVWARPTMVFVPHRDGKGAPLSDGRGALALWWTRGTRTRWLTTWGALDRTQARFSLGRWHHYEAYGYTDAIAGSGPALVLRGGRLSALLAQSNLVPTLVRHVPFADGVPDPPLVLRDFDDRERIRAGLCAGLNWPCPQRCGRLTDPCVQTTSAKSDRRCDLPRLETWEAP